MQFVTYRHDRSGPDLVGGDVVEQAVEQVGMLGLRIVGGGDVVALRADAAG